jgi:copper(I)-binding protein
MSDFPTSVRPFRRPSSLLLAGVAVVAFAGVACGSDDDGGDIVVADAWIREPAEGAANSAAYATIANETGDEVTLVGASVPVSATVEIHETLMGDDGTMSMQEREDGFAIADGETFLLEPGGPHVMMLGIDPSEFTEGFDVTFEFDNGDEITVPAELRAIGMDDMDDMNMDDGSMDEMDDGSMDDMGDDGSMDEMDDMDDDGSAGEADDEG